MEEKTKTKHEMIQDHLEAVVAGEASTGNIYLDHILRTKGSVKVVKDDSSKSSK